MDFDEFLSDYETEARRKRAAAISVEIESYFSFKTEDVMDFGCKTGLVAFNLKNKVNKLFLIDSSEEMIQCVNHKLLARPQTNIETYCGEIMETDLNKEFDIIYASLALYHTKDPQATVHQLTSYIKKNGKLIIVDLLPAPGKAPFINDEQEDQRGFTIDKMTQILEKSGLVEVLGRKFYSSYKRINQTSRPYSLFSIVGSKP